MVIFDCFICFIWKIRISLVGSDYLDTLSNLIGFKDNEQKLVL